MSWIVGVGIGVVVVLVAVWAWVTRERNVSPDYGTISEHWRSEQRMKDRESSDR